MARSHSTPNTLTTPISVSKRVHLLLGLSVFKIFYPIQSELFVPFLQKKPLDLKKLTQVSAMKERSYWLTQNKRENKRTAYNNWNRNPSQHLLGTQN